MVQRHLAGAYVVKGFNNIDYAHLAALPRPVDAPDRTALPIAGNDPGARKQAAELISLLGYDCVVPPAEGRAGSLTLSVESD
ncbi:hypothetical protein ACTXG6_37500 [Pseudonocardia sp. Cha107L01]|uniref:hypothetical protein n=1 Tax=Pseudonocardia sp. Cha107L01 TaxID=3457576 RepID=UPI00403EE50E